MLASIPIPLPDKNIRDEIGNLVLKANQLRNEAWFNEQDAITKLENLIARKQTPQTQIDEVNAPPRGSLQENVDTIQKPSALGELTFAPDAPPIWELVARISAQVPDEEWNKTTH